jgi:uncharacterized membrane protein
MLTATLNAHAISNQLHSWKVLPEPERLTELYFTNPTKLPTVYTAGVTQDVSFTVHNIEYAPVSYTYQVHEQPENTTNAITLTGGNFTIVQDQQITVPLHLTLTDVGARAKIVIYLSFREPGASTNTMQQIDYWVSRTPQAKGGI